MHGGFFGVEVFFVVSGFLITSLLIDEHDRNEHIAFGKFWIRRARRLFPALYAACCSSASGRRSQERPSSSRSSGATAVWSIFYVNNWGQILGDVPYFAARCRCSDTCGAWRSRSSGT